MLAPAHERDAHIEFDEPAHKYTIHGATDYTSVTTYIGKLFEPFEADAIITKMMKGKNWTSSKYYGMTAEAIKLQWEKAGQDAAAEGTKMHADIEHFYKGEPFENESKEYAQFKAFSAQCGLRPYRSEWRVYNEDIKIVGTVDMIFEHPDGSVSIYDWKRCKKLEKNDPWKKRARHENLNHIPDTNYWHYAMQLNLYQFILESKYGLRVASRVLVCCHPEREIFEEAPVPDLQHEIRALFQAPQPSLWSRDPEPHQEVFRQGCF